MATKMSEIAEESIREYQRYAQDFVTFVNKAFAELDIHFSSANKSEFRFIFGPTWPKCLSGGLFCSMYIRHFEKACNRGLVGEGDAKAPRYEWHPEDADFLTKYQFSVRDVTGFHYSQDHLDFYNAYGTIYGFRALKDYAEDFRIAANLADLSAAHINAAVLIRGLSAPKKETSDEKKP